MEKKLDYFQLFVSEMIIIYILIKGFFSLHYDIHLLIRVDIVFVILIVLLVSKNTHELNMKIKNNGEKSYFYPVALIISSALLMIFYLNRYDLEIFSSANLIYFALVGIIVTNDYIYRTKDEEYFQQLEEENRNFFSIHTDEVDESLKYETIINDANNKYQISFYATEIQIWKNIKNELLSFYQPNGFSNITIDNDTSWMLQHKNNAQAYIYTSYKDDRVNLEVFNTKKPDIAIVKHIINQQSNKTLEKNL